MFPKEMFMQKLLRRVPMSNVKCFNIKQGINLYYIPEKKFKTNYISINIHNELKHETAALCALLSDVLGRGCKKYPTETAVSEYMQELYGSAFKVDIRRKGVDQILALSATCVNDEYLPENEGIFNKVLEFLFDALLEPKVYNNAFDELYVNQEKINLINDIEAMINDKRTYSVWRLTELMFKGKPYSVYELGDKESVKEITGKALFKFYSDMLKNCPMDIFVVGDVNVSQVLSYVEKRLENICPINHNYPKAELYCESLNEKEITEKFDVTQSKLCMGYKTSVDGSDDDYYKLMVANGILGGGAHSKLFNEVREKLSLAYYAGSRLVRFNGTLMVSAGIEAKNKDMAIKEIKTQVDLLKQGIFTDEEFNATIKNITGSIRILGDSIGYLCDYYLGNAVTNTLISPDEFAQKIESVTKDDVVSVAKNLELEMIYFLTGKESEEK